MNKTLIRKYNVPGPRYTSYPTVPYWEDNSDFNVNLWKEHVQHSFNHSNSSEGISLYIHLPFCEHLCHYCGCNKKITKQHSVEEPYINRVIKEWHLYQELFDEKPQLIELHLGGGTPTFLSAENLKFLIEGILDNCTIHPNAEFSFEAHPSSTDESKLQVLFDLGFRRLSLGVQDFDEEVQRIINRKQSFEEVKQVSDLAQRIGYTSINYDLIFGLPKQSKDSIENTINQTILLKPDRIAYYSYAHVPWVSKSQRLYSEIDLPDNDYKRELYELGKDLLEQAGYIEIGMDHFALAEDELSRAAKSGSLHRNFMGYTTAHSNLMIGLGVSSIGDSWNAFGQNVKTLKEYERLLDANQLPLMRGHFLNQEDLIIRKHILQLMCQFETTWSVEESLHIDFDQIQEQLIEMESDGLVLLEPNTIKITESGKAVVRNVCMAFDLRLKRKKPSSMLFSQTV